MGEDAALPLEITLPARLQLDYADAWWQVNRTAAPNAIYEDFRRMSATLARSPGIGRRATINTKKKNVRQVFLHVIYYRVFGSPPVLEILAFWHSRRGKGPPI